MPDLKYIPLDEIRVNPVSLRDVQRTGEGFLELVNAIRAQGVMNPISVKSKPGEDGKKYELVDGLQRFSASLEVGTGTRDNGSGVLVDKTGPDGKPTKVGVIPAQVIERDEANTIVAQIIANAHRIETRPVEYAKAIFKYIGYNPGKSLVEVAADLSKNPQWVSKQMNLLKLHDQIKPLVDEGKVPLANAYVMAKMPPEEQLQWLERAQTLPADQFAAAGAERIKAIRDANRKGQNAGEEKFIPVPHIRKKGELEAESQKPEIGPALIRDLAITKDLAPNKAGLEQAAQSGFQLALSWVLSMDPRSVDLQRQKYENQKKADAEAKVRRDAEKAQKREQELAQKAKEAAETARTAREAAAKLPPETVPV